MERKHPHADAHYEVFQQQDMTFGVRVTIPDSHPTTITSFATAAAAAAWIDEHKDKVVRGVDPRRRRFPGFARG